MTEETETEIRTQTIETIDESGQRVNVISNQVWLVLRSLGRERADSTPDYTLENGDRVIPRGIDFEVEKTGKKLRRR